MKDHFKHMRPAKHEWKAPAGHSDHRKDSKNGSKNWKGRSSGHKR